MSQRSYFRFKSFKSRPEEKKLKHNLTEEERPEWSNTFRKFEYDIESSKNLRYAYNFRVATFKDSFK